MGSTWCARLGRIAGMRRGVNGTIVSWAKSRNSAIHRREVERCISSSESQALVYMTVLRWCILRWESSWEMRISTIAG